MYCRRKTYEVAIMLVNTVICVNLIDKQKIKGSRYAVQSATKTKAWRWYRIQREHLRFFTDHESEVATHVAEQRKMMKRGRNTGNIYLRICMAGVCICRAVSVVGTGAG